MEENEREEKRSWFLSGLSSKLRGFDKNSQFSFFSYEPHFSIIRHLLLWDLPNLHAKVNVSSLVPSGTLDFRERWKETAEIFF